MVTSATPLAPVPDWTEECAWKLGGRDFLGLQSVGETILNALLPGLTNSTVHPRYFAFFAWVFKIASDRGIEVGEALNSHVFRYETALIYAAEAKHKGALRNIVGIRGARHGVLGWSGPERSYSVTSNSQTNRISAFSSTYYRPSFSKLRLLDVNQSGTISLRPEGQLLAEAFESQLSAHTALRALAGRGKRISGRMFIDLHDDFCPCAVRNHNRADRMLLVEDLFRFERPATEALQSEGERSRRLSLAYVLDLVRDSEREEWDEDSIRTLIYYWQHSTRRYTPPEFLLRTAEGWRIFQAQQYERYALETLWAAFIRILADRTTLSF